jgi:LemA protein
MVLGYKPKPSFTVENEQAISKPPTVDFSKPESSQEPARNKQ